METPTPGGVTHVLALDELREQLAVCSGVLCPTTGPKPADCPLQELRREQPKQIREWLAGLNGEELEFLAQYQEGCRAANRQATGAEGCSP